MAAVSAIIQIINIVFVKLQEKDMLVSQQLEELGDLAVMIYSQVGIRGPYTKDEFA